MGLELGLKRVEGDEGLKLRDVGFEVEFGESIMEGLNHSRWESSKSEKKIHHKSWRCWCLNVIHHLVS